MPRRSLADVADRLIERQARLDSAQRHNLDEASALTEAAKQFERDAWRIGRLCLLD
jgi:hypothetical protein